MAPALVACGSGDSGPVDFAEINRQSEIIFQADSSLAQSVRLDSAAWQPRFLGISLDDVIEVEGDYTLCFSNLGDQALALRYDLRFFDAETFLVDVFNPFNLPLLLAPAGSQCINTEFIIRADTLRQAETLALMRVTVQLYIATNP
jgi:hypothetical protein